MYPCLEENHSFGYAITGLINHGGIYSLPVVLQMSDYEEPNIRNGEPAVNMTGTVTCYNVYPSVQYALYRFNKGNAGVPKYASEYPAFADEVINFYVSPEN